jgi:type III secretion protein V
MTRGTSLALPDSGCSPSLHLHKNCPVETTRCESVRDAREKRPLYFAHFADRQAMPPNDQCNESSTAMSTIQQTAGDKPRDAGSAAVQFLTRYNDIVLAGVVVAVISLMVFPLPPFALDSLIAVNLAASVGLLMMALYVPSAIGLSTFPSLLLFTTLFRLALNIASTKQILLNANAGHIIDTFGNLVVGGNVIVGIVVFLIIAIVQFIVVAKGSERVAEVGARFTLDAMPGKQMSIDADMRAGIITADEGRQRRAGLERESQLHGAMDGAMKFVKGDAIAALIIAFVNIVAGIAIGTLMLDMAVGDAVNRYTILTVGDGMVSQIPSLFVSIAAGILITRVASDDDSVTHLGGEIGQQLMAQPMALLVTGGVLVGFVLVPGFPKLQFIVLTLVVGGIGILLLRNRRSQATYERTPVPSMRRDGSAATPPGLIDETQSALTVPLLLRIAPDLRGRIDPARFDIELGQLRERLLLDLGAPFPGVTMRYAQDLAPGHYAIWVQELPTAAGELPADGGQVGIEAELMARLEPVMRKHAAAFIGMQEVHGLIARCEARYPELAAEVQRALPLQRITEVLRRLVQEGVPIRNLREIFESLIVWGPKEKDVLMLTEYVRVDLGRYIAHRYGTGQDALQVIMLDPRLEAAIRQSVQQTPAGSFLALPPDQSQRVLDQLTALLDRAGTTPMPLLLASMDVRRYVKKLIEPSQPTLAVLSYQEVGSHRALQAVGRVEV